jgi:hypothetical protein
MALLPSRKIEYKAHAPILCAPNPHLKNDFRLNRNAELLTYRATSYAAARCTACGRKGAIIQRPGWGRRAYWVFGVSDLISGAIAALASKIFSIGNVGLVAPHRCPNNACCRSPYNIRRSEQRAYACPIGRAINQSIGFNRADVASVGPKYFIAGDGADHFPDRL